MRFSLCLAAILALVAAKPKAPVAPPGTLAGSVRSGSAVVLDATVHVWQGKKEVTVHVDAKGEFHLPLADGTYETQASAPQFRPALPMRITVVVHSQQQTWVNLEMLPGS